MVPGAPGTTSPAPSAAEIAALAAEAMAPLLERPPRPPRKEPLSPPCTKKRGMRQSQFVARKNENRVTHSETTALTAVAVIVAASPTSTATASTFSADCSEPIVYDYRCSIDICSRRCVCQFRRDIWSSGEWIARVCIVYIVCPALDLGWSGILRNQTKSIQISASFPLYL